MALSSRCFGHSEYELDVEPRSGAGVSGSLDLRSSLTAQCS